MKSKKIKMLIVTTLTASMILSMGLVGCGAKGNNENSANNENVAAKPEDSNLTKNGEYPVVKDAITVSVFAPMPNGVTSLDYDKNLTTKWLQDKSNVNIDWQTCSASDRDAKKNAMLTSGTYPEVMLSGYFTLSEQYLYGKQGVFMPLNDLIDKYAPNYKKYLEEYPSLKDSVTAPDGNMYSLTSIQTTFNTQAQNKMWINQKWLDNLNLEMPTTTEEFYNVLKAFKEQDANGNGDPNDEVPLTGATDAWNAQPEKFILNAFVPYINGYRKGLFVEDGKVTFSKTEDGWKDGLAYMNKLYNEGLLDSLAYSQNKDQLKKVANTPGVDLVGACPGGSISSFKDLSTGNWQDYVAVPALEGPDGEQNVAWFSPMGNADLVLTDKCENPEAVIRMWDLFFTEEGALWNVIGEAGVDYENAAASDVNFEGEPADYKRITTPDQRDGRTWNQLGARFANFNWAVVPGDIEEVLYKETKEKYFPYKAPDEEILPALAFSEEDSREILDIEASLNKYIDEMFIKFVMGTADVNKEWDSYISECKKLGVERWVELHQKAYDEKVASAK